MSGASIFALIVLSLLGLGYLAATDPKRRRIFGQSKLEGRLMAWPARVAAFAPGMYLTVIGHWSGLTIWAGAVTTIGWAMVAIPPTRYAEARSYLSKTVDRASNEGVPYLSGVAHALTLVGRSLWHLIKQASRLLFSAIPSVQTSDTTKADTIERLEARVAELEKRLQALEQPSSSAEEDAVPTEPRTTTLKPQAVKNLDAAE